MVGPTCPVCGDGLVPKRFGRTDLEVCASCGYGASPYRRPEDHDYWHDDTRQEDIGESFWLDAKKRYFQGALKLLAAKTSGRRLLDLGGGAGFFTQIAVGEGWDAHSFDISPKAQAAAAERVGARAPATLDDFTLGAFDVVTIWCVIAHVPDPGPLLDEAARFLAPGGILWLTTPNFRFEKLKCAVASMKGNEVDFRGADHIGHFDSACLSRLLSNHGFSDPRLHFRGITEQCMVAKRSRRVLVEAKRTFNATSHLLGTLRLPYLASELQVTARRR